MKKEDLQALKVAMRPVQELMDGSDAIEQMRKQIRRVLQVIAGNFPATNSHFPFVCFLDEQDLRIEICNQSPSIVDAARPAARYEIGNDGQSLPLHLVIPVAKGLPKVLNEALKNGSFKKSYDIFAEASALSKLAQE